MLKITVLQDEANRCLGFEAKDHAGYAKKGKDVVCAAASMLIQNTVNSIERFCDDLFDIEADEKNGLIRFMLQGTSSDEAQLLLKSMYTGLTDLEEDPKYKDYIDVIFQRKAQ
ncbi:MAG: ribosomal-processing cysteine protease Prp [Lachnospiraceae bacterium]|jgi:uncharacterized protein YsxB (DUF464 family)|nr:ribosomal-processing cysteine protease Prp [Lachnospiraceae bacterium]